VPDATGRSRGRFALVAWTVTGLVLVINGATMLGFAGGVDDSLRAAVLGLGIVVLVLGGLALARAVQLYRRPPA